MEELTVGALYSNEEIFRGLSVSNAGGIRPFLVDGSVRRAVVMTSDHNDRVALENPYHDRLEADILSYTAAGKLGEQTLSGVNSRLIEQLGSDFPMHGFTQVASRRDRVVGARRWRYLGLLEYLRHYPDTQIDSQGKVRKVWLFEFRVHSKPSMVPVALDGVMAAQVLTESRAAQQYRADEEVVTPEGETQDQGELAAIRGKLLALDPRAFEFFIRDLLVKSGFSEVCVTRYSSDGGIDVNARAGSGMWIFESDMVQVQAKRWLHSVGRKEVAELRGSLQPFAKGAVVTTSHFSKAAINEACAAGKNPIALIDGYRLSGIVRAGGLQV